MNQDTHIRIIFLADTHLGFDYPVRPRIHRRRRGDDFFANFQRVLKYAEFRNADLIIHGGDFFFRAKVPKKIIELSYEPLLKTAEAGLPIYIVPGNHERSRLPNPELIAHKNIHIFDVPKTYHSVIKNQTISISGFPCQRKDIQGEFESLINQTNHDQSAADIKILCFHQSVEGAQVGPSDFTFKRGADVISKDQIPTVFDLVLSGHIHRRQVLKGLKDNKEWKVIYPGSTERTSFAEKDEPKGFFEIVINFDGKKRLKATELKFIRLPARSMENLELGDYDKLQDLKLFLQKQIVHFDSDAVLRLRLKNHNSSTRELVTSSLLREILPDTMNFQFGHEFYRKDKK